MPIFYKFKPLENDGLRDRLTKLGERAGTRVRGVYEWKLSEKSKKANAALTGMGSTRRIILSDTLLEHYSDDEIEAILAHELGHHVHRHILKSIFMQVGITFFGFWLVNQVLRFVIAKDWFPVLDPRLYDFANLPLIVLVVTVLGFLLMPALNAVSRHHEREADRYAWENISAIASLHQLDAEAGRPEPRRARAVAVCRVALPLASVDWQAGRGRRGMGEQEPAGRGSIAHLVCLRRIVSTRCKSSSVSTPMVSNGVSATCIGTPWSRNRSCSRRSLRSSSDSGQAQNASSAALR